MAYEEFPDTLIGPTYPIAVSVEPRLLKTEFGDGYTQQAPDGLNYKLKTFDLIWEVLLPAEKIILEDFIEDKGGYKTFLWTSPDDVAYKVKCPKWSFSSDNPATWSFRGTFNEVPM